MKKIKVLLAAFVLAGMTVVSCSSDDSGPAATIDGKWNQVKTVVKLGNQSVTQDYTHETGCDKDYVEFAASSVYNEVSYNNVGSGDCAANASDAGTWIKTDDKLTIANGSQIASDTYDIKKLSGSDLQLSVTDSNGGISTITTIYLKKAAN